MKIVFFNDPDPVTDIHVQDIATGNKIIAAFSKNARRAFRAHTYQQLIDKDPSLRVHMHLNAADIKNFQDNFEAIWDAGERKAPVALFDPLKEYEKIKNPA